MLSYRFLSSDDFLALYECFCTAFSDYQVDMQMSEQDFAQRLARVGVRLDLSAGAFDDERMVGFYINAFGLWQGKQTAYDAGTGVIPDFRRRGVGVDLFAFMETRLKQESVSQYLLEVLTTNERAVPMYRRLGFEVRRDFAVIRSQLAIAGGPAEVSVHRIDDPNWELFKTFWDGYPSWQNSIEAVDRARSERLLVAAFADSKCVGYGVAYPPAGMLMQIAVSPEYRRRGIGRGILKALHMGETLKVNNIDEELKGTLAFFEANGFQTVARQFEMSKTL